MRAVNLIPADARRGGGRGRGAVGTTARPIYALIGMLAVALGFVTIYVLTANTVSDRKAKLTTLKAQAAQAQAQASRLSPYTEFAKLAQARATTIREIAATRFDWHGALADLSRVVPANTSLLSLLGTVAPGASVTGAGGSVASSGASTSTLRSGIPSPAFELKGCTRNQNDVARLMSRLRVINGVMRVTLADSQKADAVQGGAVGTPGVSASQGCGSNTPNFDVVVFFQPLPNAGPTGIASAPQGASTNTPTPGSGGTK
jgi:Tfp pilus assembly protein PilN